MVGRRVVCEGSGHGHCGLIGTQHRYSDCFCTVCGVKLPIPVLPVWFEGRAFEVGPESSVPMYVSRRADG